MKKQQKDLLIRSLPVYLFCAALIVLVLYVFQQNPVKHPSSSLGESIAQYIRGDDPQLRTMQDIINARTMWNPVLEDWYGQTAPDFAINDIHGREFRLSDYLGREVIIVLWATWCPPCRMEVPHLKELRKQFGRDELVILAISNESAQTVRVFAEAKQLNYTVASLQSGLPEPYQNVNALPSSFYINKKGVIKLAVEGFVPFGQAQAIIKVEK